MFSVHPASHIPPTVVYSGTCCARLQPRMAGERDLALTQKFWRQRQVAALIHARHKPRRQQHGETVTHLMALSGGIWSDNAVMALSDSIW